MVRRWLTTPSYLKELAAPPHAGDPDAIFAATERHIDHLHALSEDVFGEFIRRFYRTRRRLALASR